GADGRGYTCAQMARRTNIAGKFWMHLADLGNFVHGGIVDFFLSVETGAHGPFMKKMQERTSLDEANGFGVWQQIKSDFRRYAKIEELVLRRPGITHGAFVDFLGPGILAKKHRSDVIGLACIGKREKGTRTGNHAVALVLTVRGVTNFLRESVGGVLQRAH